jgi:hypothetical protein
MLFDKAGVNLVLDEQIVRKYIDAEGDGRFYRLDYKFAEGPLHGGNGFGSGPVMGNELTDH